MRLLLILLTIFPSFENSKEEAIPLKREEYCSATPVRVPPPTYQWEKEGPAAITKDFFRCKGCHSNPAYTYEGERISDCSGWHKHSLPVKERQEFIYPILISLLNHIQQQTKHKVIITSGHRCPQHNTYVDPTHSNQYSKHLIGAEVSFYVEGMEPLSVVEILQEYYKEAPLKRFEGETNVSTPPWLNKEIFIKLFKENEGRNLDNQHSLPYLSIQVRYDTEREEKVIYTWAAANRGVFLK